MKFLWKVREERYGSNTHHLLVGRIRVGQAGYSGMVQRGDPDTYVYYCDLPGLKEEVRSRRYETLEEAKNALESLATRWFALTSKDYVEPKTRA